MYPLLLIGGGLLAYMLVTKSSSSEKTLTIDSYCKDTLNKWFQGMTKDQYDIMIKAMSTNEGLETIAAALDKNGRPDVAQCVRALKK